MKKYFKFPGRFGPTAIAIFIVALVGVNIYLYKSSAALEDINRRLDTENHVLNLEIEKSQSIEKRLRKEISEKRKRVRKLDLELADAVQQYQQLKKESHQADTPKDPKSFKELEECKQQYGNLAADFLLTLDTANAADNSLKLCLDKAAKQERIISFQELAYIECQEQGRLKELKIQKTQEAMQRMDRYYKRKLLKNSVVKYAIGLLVGIALGRFIFKSKK